MILRFVTGNDFISNAIRMGERDGWCTHVEASMPDSTLLGAHLDGGVQARPMGYDKGTRTRELMIGLTPFEDTNHPPGMEDRFHDFLRSQIGKPYDTLGILGAALDRDWRNPSSWFCSELIAAALETCGYLNPLTAMNSHISPRDLLLILSGRIPVTNAA